MHPAPRTPHLTKVFEGKKVLVTGHTGFKGAWLCEWLVALGAEITGVSLPTPVSSPSLFDELHLGERLRDLRGDIRNTDAISKAIRDFKPDFLLHLAAQPLVRESYRTPTETWQTNVLGTINVLEALRNFEHPCAAVMITTDKCYLNREWLHAYREEDPLGGHDPYSSSKAAAEIAISSWRDSFFPPDHPVRIASARAGNVIGGGDWATDRIVPDAIRSLRKGEPVPVRNRTATRPWQHVLEPLSGYLQLAAHLETSNQEPGTKNQEQSTKNEAPRTKKEERRTNIKDLSFNFGPDLPSNKTVADLVQEILIHWPGEWEDRSDPNAPHEAGKLNLATDKAFHVLGWRPRWGFSQTIQKTVQWYRQVHQGANPKELTQQQILEYAG